ncbi:MAG: hypothetical protein B5M54_09435 [Candidatus Aminicenantes bacterium 4484_214]|nr:MAG: hypothetical protein B5M54_09435 [Candidatus Aminicenantes bacterium 4484_214]
MSLSGYYNLLNLPVQRSSDFNFSWPDRKIKTKLDFAPHLLPTFLKKSWVMPTLQPYFSSPLKLFLHRFDLILT